MSTLTFRNSRGALVVMLSVAATKVKNEFGAILAKAVHGGAVAITRHDRPKAVLLSYDEFESLSKVRSRILGDLGAKLEDLGDVDLVDPYLREVYDEFESLSKECSRILGDLGAEFDDLLARMQTPKARKAMKAAFNASPAELGRAAKKAARKAR